MLLGVNVDFAKAPAPATLKTERVRERPRTAGGVAGSGSRFVFSYNGPDTAMAINRLLAQDARVEFAGPSRIAVTGVPRDRLERVAREFGLRIEALQGPLMSAPGGSMPLVLRAPRIGVYSPWTGSNVDGSWTQWVLEEYGFDSTTVDSREVRRGSLRQRFDVLIIADQNPREVLDGQSGNPVRPELSGGIGEDGVEHLTRFVEEGGTLITLGAASELAVDHLPIPVRDAKRGLRRDQHFAPGTIVRIEVDTSHPIGFGMPTATHGFYTNGPLLVPLDGVASSRATVVARYPATDVLASGWLRGQDVMAGRAAVVAIEMDPGRVVLFGMRPQHRAQTHATFPLLFNALYLAAASPAPVATNQ
jgi:hypothetical protein